MMFKLLLAWHSASHPSQVCSYSDNQQHGKHKIGSDTYTTQDVFSVTLQKKLLCSCVQRQRCMFLQLVQNVCWPNDRDISST